MLKKVVVLLISAVVSFSIIGCSKNSDNTSKAVDNKKQEQVKKGLNTQTVDGLTLTINSRIEQVKGDRTKDNYSDDKGEYFAKGSDIVKAADYKNIVVEMDIKNDTSRSIEINPLYVSAELQDGYKLSNNIDGSQEDQVQSKATGKYKFSFVVKNDIKADKVKLSYLWIKNEEEFKKLVQDPNVSKMSEEEAKEKYKDVYTNIKFETDIQK